MNLSQATEQAEEEVVAAGPEFSILAKLRSSKEEERELACNGLANIVMEEKEAIMRHPTALAHLVGCLKDTVPAVQVAAAGALHNLTLSAGQEAAQALLRQGVLAPLLALLQTANTLKQEQSSSAAESTPQQQDLTLAVLTQAVALLSSLVDLAEVDSRSLSLLNRAVLSLLPLLSVSTNVDLSGFAPLVGQLFHALSEDNAELSQFVFSDEKFLGLILSLLERESSSPVLSVLLVGSLLNLECTTKAPQVMLKYCFPVLEHSLKFDAMQSLRELLVFFQSSQETLENKELAFKRWEQHMQAQRLCFETCANLFASLQEVSELVAGSGPRINSSKRSLLRQILNGAQSPKLLAMVVDKCNFSPQQVLQLLASNSDLDQSHIVNPFRAVQLAALGCLSNMLLLDSLSYEPIEMISLWNFLSKMCEELASVEQMDTICLELLEHVTNSMWTLLRRAGNPADSKSCVLVPSQGVATVILKLATPTLSTPPPYQIQIHAIGMLAFVGQFAQLQPFIEDLGKVLVQAFESFSSSPALIAEALNTVFDVFAEPVHNDVFAALNMMHYLQSFVSWLEQQMQQPHDEDLLERIDETKTNLINFIAYKQQQGM
ncbi:protein import into nucleus, variant 2 [Balamuthia mandrillaris]